MIKRSPLTSRCPRPLTSGGAFSLIELLVVISIVGLLVATSFPFLRQMVRSSSETMAADGVSNAVSAARALATRYKPFTDTINNGKSAEDDGDGYSGAAVIVTPANELRIVENYEQAVDQLGNRMELPPTGTLIRNGYVHVEGIDDLRVSGRAALLGIRRTGTNEIELLPPPFAISFNRRGGLVVRDTRVSGAISTAGKRSDGFVYYDGNGDGRFDTGSDRGSAAGVALTGFARGNAPRITRAGDMEGRREIPFEQLEPVVGVVIFSPNDLPGNIVADNDNPDAGLRDQPYDPERAEAYVIDTNDTTNRNLLEWASEPGQGVVMFFNRNTGADMNR
ncbi:MAG: prepilin-type N-terminal cleavage/methylation domain-containing protein [Planctomycetota bacterium]